MASKLRQHRHKAMKSCGLLPEFGGISWQTGHTTHTGKEFYVFILVYLLCLLGKKTNKAVGKQPLSETDRNGKTTLKWISGKCAMGALTKFRIYYKRVCHNVCTVNIQHWEEMVKTAYALESRWANGTGLFLCPTVQHAVNQQGLSTAAMAVSLWLLKPDAQVEF